MAVAAVVASAAFAAAAFGALAHPSEERLHEAHAAAAVEEAAREEAERDESREEEDADDGAPHVEAEEAEDKVGDADEVALDVLDGGARAERRRRRQVDDPQRQHRDPAGGHPQHEARPLRLEEAVPEVRVIVADLNEDPAEGSDEDEDERRLQQHRLLDRVVDRQDQQEQAEARRDHGYRVRDALQRVVMPRLELKEDLEEAIEAGDFEALLDALLCKVGQHVRAREVWQDGCEARLDAADAALVPFPRLSLLFVQARVRRRRRRDDRLFGVDVHHSGRQRLLHPTRAAWSRVRREGVQTQTTD